VGARARGRVRSSDALGSPLYRGLPGSREVTYAYDTAGLLQTVTAWGSRWASFAYDAAGRRTSITRSNGVGSTIGYDAAGQTTSIVHAAGGNTLQSFCPGSSFLDTSCLG
jgi:YD repeat-containing protein